VRGGRVLKEAIRSFLDSFQPPTYIYDLCCILNRMGVQIKDVNRAIFVFFRVQGGGLAATALLRDALLFSVAVLLHESK